MPKERSSGIILFTENNDDNNRNNNKNNNSDGERFYLLLHYAAGHWDFPKGHIEGNENEIETALREVKEETGISNITLIDGFNEKIEYYFKRGTNTVHKEVVFFLGRVPHDTPVYLSHEHIGYEWLPYNEAIERLTYDTAKGLLMKANKRLS